MGCAGWSGRVSYSYASTDPAVGEKRENHLTEVTFRPTEWPESFPEELRVGLYMRPEPASMVARFSGWYLDGNDPPGRCSYDKSDFIPVLQDASYLILTTDGSHRYGAFGRVPLSDSLDVQSTCGEITLDIDLSTWWNFAVTTEEGERLKISPDGRTLGGSFVDGKGGIYRWELTATPRE